MPILTPAIVNMVRRLGTTPNRARIFKAPSKLTPFVVAGITRDSVGTALGNCTVDIFDTASDMKLASTVSDASGNYSISLGQNSGYFYCVGYKVGSPDVSGTTVNFVVGTDAAQTGVSPPTQVDVYLDMENSTDGTIVTGTIANNATHSTGSPGTWHTRKTVDDAVLTQLFVSTAQEKKLRKPILVGSTQYDDAASTRSWKMHNSVDIEYLKYVFTTTKSKVSMGVAMYFSSANTGWGTTTNSFDVMAIHGGSEFLVLNLDDKGTAFGIPGDFMLRLHTNTGADHGNGVGLSGQTVYGFMNTWYWVTMLWDKNAGGTGNAQMAIYEMTNFNQLSGSPLNLEMGARADADFTQCGRSDGHGAGSQINADYYFDDVIIDITNAVWPLYPQ